VARGAAWGTLEPARGKPGPLSTVATLEFRNRHVDLKKASFDLAGAKLDLRGTYGFDGAVNLGVRADLRHVRRRWLNHGDENNAAPLLGEFRLIGPLDKLVVAPQMRVSSANP
jgi:hypothetical protein